MIFALVGAAGMIRPLRRVHRGKRRHAAVMFLIGAAAAYAISWSMPRTRASGAQHGIDEFTPAYHFRKQHEITIAAPGLRAIKARAERPA